MIKLCFGVFKNQDEVDFKTVNFHKFKSFLKYDNFKTCWFLRGFREFSLECLAGASTLTMIFLSHFGRLTKV